MQAASKILGPVWISRPQCQNNCPVGWDLFKVEALFLRIVTMNLVNLSAPKFPGIEFFAAFKVELARFKYLILGCVFPVEERN